tara:strand:+ start:545 stop:1693 length:1149 start_codon:yes stop_codon:yes gene_type:complete
MEGFEVYATPRQLEILQALKKHGSQRKAAEALGINHSNIHQVISAVRAKATKHGFSPDHDMTHPVPDGFKLKGTSTLYDDDGNQRLQWVKSTADNDRQEEMFREAVEAMAESLPRSKAVAAPKATAENLMACYPVGDHHFGMLSWHEETGDDYDIKIGERLLMGAMDHLVKSVPKCGAATIVLLGDFLHIDTFKSTSESGHLLDSDSRYPRMVRAAIRAVRYMIRTALQHHAKVHVVVEIGNHDLSSSVFLMECLHNIYEKEDRVSIDRSPRHFHYFSHGSCLVGVHHGHGTKMANLPLIMAADRPEEWGKATHRYWWTGHIHHDSVKDHAGCRVESFRILPPADAWAANKGYRSGRDMKAIVLHSEFGEVARHIVNPAMLE